MSTLKELIYDNKAEETTTEEEGFYSQLIDKVREYLSQHYSEELALSITDIDKADTIKSIIKIFVEENNEYVKGYSLNDLTDMLYRDMIGFSFLEKYIKDADIEEICCNSFDNIEIITPQGRFNVSDKFSSPLTATNMLKKMVRLSGDIIDESQPITESYIANGVRVSGIIPPIIDKEAGAASTIRKQKMAKVTKQELINLGTATNEMLDFMVFCVEHGVSMGFAGKTSSGKTTDIAFILNAIDDNKRIFSIEETREINFSGKNSVIATRTRKSANKALNIDMNDLLRTALRFTPDIICVAEMRGAEAMAAQEASRTGHTVITTFHAENAQQAYDRILSMCQMSDTRIPSDFLLRFIVNAFPIMVFKSKLMDGSRKVIEIVEAVGIENNNVVVKMLYQYNYDTECFEKVNSISDNLIKKMMINGATKASINRFIGGGKK